MKMTLNRQEKTIAIDAVVSKLTDKGIGVFYILLQNKNTLVNRNDILSAVWGETDYFTARSMDVYLCHLRKALATAEGISIKNKHTQGFMLLVDDSVEIEVI